MRKLYLITVFLLLGVTLLAQRPKQFGFALSQFQTAPNFKVKMSDGKTIDLKKMRGKVVLLDFGAPTCGPCIAAQKTFQKKLFDKYSPKDLVVVPMLGGVKNWEEVAAFQKRHGFDFPFGRETKGHRIEGYMLNAGVPIWFVINRFGVVTGMGTSQDYADAVEKAIAQTENIKIRKLQGVPNMITPEVGKRLIAVAGYAIDAFIDMKDPNAKSMLQVVELAKAKYAPIEMEIVEGTLKVVSVKELPKPVKVEVAEEKIVWSDKGVKFESLTLAEALIKAKQENKKVFLDCYTEYCGPCKLMDKYIFSLDSIGDFFNKNFINLKYNTNKGEGKAIKERFGIAVVPNYLILNSDGTLYHRFSGSRRENVLLSEIQGVLADEKKTLPYFDKLYHGGKLPRNMFREYIELLLKSGSKEVSNVTQNLKSQIGENERTHPDNWIILEYSDYDSEDFKFVVDNRDALRKSVGTEKVDEFLGYHYRRELMKFVFLIRNISVLRQNVSKFDAIVVGLNKADFKGKPQLVKLADLIHSGIKGDKEQVTRLIKDFVATGNKENMGSMLRFVRLAGSKDDLKYILSLKDQFMANIPTVLDIPDWEDNFRVMRDLITMDNNK